MSGSAYRPFAFFGATILWTWAFWLALAVSGLEAWESPGRWLVYAGGTGPLVMGLWFQHRHSGARGLRDLWVRLIDPRFAPLWLWATALLLIPALSLMAHFVLWLGGAPEPVLALPRDSWAATLDLAVFLFLLGPLPEEIGWRGYGLDALLARVSPLAAAGLLGLGWGAWHLPLFAVPGYYDAFDGPPVLWLFLWSILMKSILMTWGYLVSNRSLLLMVVFHFMINATGEVIPMPADAEAVFQLLLTVVTVLAAVRLWRIGRRQSPCG
ncbi:CPBP family glutamic-type intramembrane protease [Frigidibacter sp. ROC022]|uniref:CPBP family glutamic-type intramembrane protease n=1 Tax=Frigidibacter sp. ROC022 TaxID=2971796 RepID=UPI00215A7128|nr:CPBP family glutamic-type intramembrane protease [Frigidibacter sp. ROC022]MCR8725086.1 CPBP family glutamic-type intramembrane protease [Frigidibacter sp. ROC022]